MPIEIDTLPVYPLLDNIVTQLRETKLLLLQAEPGAGKTSLVPWYLLTSGETGKILLLQPRRIAARAAAQRIADLLGEPLGHTVGLRTRLETLVGESTRLEVVTEGVLLRLIQSDQSLEGYSLVIFDEFHERSLQGDCALAFVWECRQLLRPDLGLLLMSATLPLEPLQRVLGRLPLIHIPGRVYPVEHCYTPPAPRESLWVGIARIIRTAILETAGDVLVFLPGFFEMNKVRQQLGPLPGVDLMILHGSLPVDEQQRVFAPPTQRRIILATNIAQTSITIPGITVVVDSGLERRVRYNPRTGMDHWQTLPISAASAAQRAGRAGRLSSGVCYRYWSPILELAAQEQPEILGADLAPLVLESVLWGAGSALELTWITSPPAGALQAATDLLKGLGLLDPAGRITPSGQMCASLGIHPRLGKMLLDSRQSHLELTAALICAVLEEGHHTTGEQDFSRNLQMYRQALHQPHQAIPSLVVSRVQREVQRILRLLKISGSFDYGEIDPDQSGALLLSAYPDRIAMRVPSDREQFRWRLASGRAAFSSADFSGAEFVVVVEMDGGQVEGRIFSAAPISREVLMHLSAGALAHSVVLEWRDWLPLAFEQISLGQLILARTRLQDIASDTLLREIEDHLSADGLVSLPWDKPTGELLNRCRFIAAHQKSFPDCSLETLSKTFRDWLLPFANVRGGVVFDCAALSNALSYYLGEHRGSLDRLAPTHFRLPSGSTRSINYDGEIPVLQARLQEFFGCTETPRVCGQPLMLHLLSPAGRPVQITRDLAGFWQRAYPEVKCELKGRYPRHYWPEDPLQAEPTARAKPRN